MFRALIVDDHALFRAGVVRLIQQMRGVEVVGEAGDGKQAIELAALLRPELVIMDLAMHGMSGLEATRQIYTHTPATRVIILSMHESEEYVRAALKAGASGYILKRSTPDELRLAIQAVGRGGLYLSPMVSRFVTGDHAVPGVDSGSNNSRLTPEQEQVFLLLARGDTTKDIAKALSVEVQTIEDYRADLARRLSLPGVAAPTQYMVEHTSRPN